MTNQGIPSFLLDCHTNENIAEIEAEYGVKGFAIIVRLWQKIYSEKGYYCEWLERSPVLFLSQWFGGNSGVDKNLICEVVDAAVRVGIFNESMFKKHAILTSERIQNQYFNVVKRRTKIEVKKEYLLVSVANFKEIVCKNEEIVCKNEETVCNFSTSKVKESKEEDNIINDINIMCNPEELFELLWQIYPCKKGKGQVSAAAKKRLVTIGKEELIRAIDRYKTELDKDKDWRKPQNGSTFFNSGYVDYLDANFVPSEKTTKPQNNFNNFNQRTYDDDELEKKLLQRR